MINFRKVVKEEYFSFSFGGIQQNINIFSSEKGGIKVSALDFSADPEMLAALFASISRNPSSIDKRMNDISEGVIDPAILLGKYYVKYGHQSIGDLAGIHLAFENVSQMLAMLVLTDFPRGSYQEASTRYIDWEKAGFVKSKNNKVDEISSEWFNIYNDAKIYLEKSFTKKGISKKISEPLIFDVLGGFLPMSARTTVCAKLDIRDCNRLLGILRSNKHLFQEISDVADALEGVLKAVMPNSVKDDNSRQELVETSIFECKDLMKKEKIILNNSKNNDFIARRIKSYMNCDSNFIPKVEDWRKVVGLRSSNIFGSFNFEFPISFRDARDIHRHRFMNYNNLLSLVPCKVKVLGLSKHRLLEEKMLNTWYLNHFDDDFKVKVFDLFKKSCTTYNSICCDNGIIGLNCMPMATMFDYFISGTLSQLYAFNITRTSGKVHPQVLKCANDIGTKVNGLLGVDLFRTGAEADYEKRSKDKKFD